MTNDGAKKFCSIYHRSLDIYIYIFIYYVLHVYEGTVRNKERRSALCEANWHENEFYLFTPVKPRKIYIKMFMEKKYNK